MRRAAPGTTIVPIAWGMAQPAGPVTAHAFERMSATLVDGYRRSSADVIFVELHGAMVADEFDDAEGELLRRIRAVVGAGCAGRRTLDLHVNMSDLMVEHDQPALGLSHLSACRLGRRPAAASRAGSTARSRGNRPCEGDPPHAVPHPGHRRLLADRAGRKSFTNTLEAIEAETGVHLNFTPGFPPADIADCGPAVFGYGADQATVRARGRSSRRCGDRRRAGLRRAARAAGRRSRRQRDPDRGASERPVVLADTQDNPGAGAPSNTTGIIAELLAQGAQGAIVGIVHDPTCRSGRACGGPRRASQHPARRRRSGAGQTPQPGPWTVVALSDGTFAGTSPMLRSKTARMGKTAVLKQNGVEVLVASIRQQPIHRETFSHLGIDPRDRRIVALKSSVHFRAGFQEIAEEVITCASPGTNLADPADFPYRKLPPGIRRRPGG